MESILTNNNRKRKMNYFIPKKESPIQLEDCLDLKKDHQVFYYIKETNEMITLRRNYKSMYITVIDINIMQVI